MLSQHHLPNAYGKHRANHLGMQRTKDKATQWTFNYAQAKTLNEGKQMRNTWSFP